MNEDFFFFFLGGRLPVQFSLIVLKAWVETSWRVGGGMEFLCLMTEGKIRRSVCGPLVIDHRPASYIHTTHSTHAGITSAIQPRPIRLRTYTSSSGSTLNTLPPAHTAARAQHLRRRDVSARAPRQLYPLPLQYKAELIVCTENRVLRNVHLCGC